jgi:hypothetical protein
MTQENKGSTLRKKEEEEEEEEEAQINIPCPLDWGHQHWHIRNHHVPCLFQQRPVFKSIIYTRIKKEIKFCKNLNICVLG